MVPRFSEETKTRIPGTVLYRFTAKRRASYPGNLGESGSGRESTGNQIPGIVEL